MSLTKEQKRRKELNINRPSNLIKLQGRYGMDLDYIPGFDDGETRKGELEDNK